MNPFFLITIYSEFLKNIHPPCVVGNQHTKNMQLSVTFTSHATIYNPLTVTHNNIAPKRTKQNHPYFVCSRLER
jgi:hypothetical protein